jgi:hypothetical protein
VTTPLSYPNSVVAKQRKKGLSFILSPFFISRVNIFVMGDKIGIPTVRSYGSSYGTYGGNRLKDYKSPKDKDLNNKDF